ncbi:MAG TPA: hypothetical protein VFM02_01875 [Candidatus Paceibacterota bacterium]|nr:hypothetical protein [Candidatus Paceibacterota bacterium]
MNHEAYLTNEDGNKDEKFPESPAFDEAIEQTAKEGLDLDEHRVIALEMAGLYESTFLEGNESGPFSEYLGNMAANAEDWNAISPAGDSFFWQQTKDLSGAREEMTESIRDFVEYEEK